MEERPPFTRERKIKHIWITLQEIFKTYEKNIYHISEVLRSRIHQMERHITFLIEK